MYGKQIRDWRGCVALLALAAACLAWAQQPTPDVPRISAASLKRTKIVAPQYPQIARDSQISGFVELNFTIQPDGSVADVEVAYAEPSAIFEDSAIKALSQWRYEPVTRNGKPIAQPAMVRMRFAL